MGQAPSFVTADTFAPALGTTHSVAVPPHDPSQGDAQAPADSVQLLFTADLASAEALARCERERIQVQAWTNAPVEGRAPGEWAAYTFEAPDADADTPDERKPPSDFSLLAPEEEQVAERHVLRLRLALRRDAVGHGQAEARFSLTYRLAFADGHVHWLGSPGHDVVCVLKRADPWLAVRRGWARAAPAEADEPGVEVWKHEEGSREGSVPFAQIRQTGRWGCWAIGRGSVHYHLPGTDIPDASFLLLLPRLHPTTFALHRPLLLRATSGSLHLSSSGMLVCAPSTRIHVHGSLPVDPIRLHAVLAALGIRWLGAQSGYALLASAEGALPARLAFVPHLSGGAPARLRCSGLEQSLFADADAYRRYMLFCPASRQMLDYATDVDYDGALRIGAAGGACVLSPIHALPAADDVAWEMAVLSPYTDVPPPAAEPEPQEKAEVDVDADAEAADPEPARASVARRMPDVAPAVMLQTLAVLVQALFLRMFFLLTPRFGNLSVPRSASPSVRAPSPDEKPDADSLSRGESPAADYTDTETLAGTEVPSGPAPPALAFDVPEGPLELVYCRQGKGEDRVLEVLLDGEPLDLSPQDGWTLTAVEGVRGGRLEAFLRDKRAEVEV